MINQNASCAGYIIKLRPHQVLAFRIDESPFAIALYGGVAHIECAYFLELGVDHNLTGIVDIAPAVADVDRGAILLENPSLIKYRVNHNLAALIDISPLFSGLHWSQPFPKASRQNCAKYEERGTPGILILRGNDHFSLTVDVSNASVLQCGKEYCMTG